jgi:16S rRNA (guanine527-N7)-methyltransferase
MTGAGRAETLAALDVSRETEGRLDALVAHLAKWNAAINLVGRSTLGEVWTRHILDSAQLFELAPNGAQSWADLGSGAGFPGLVVAILAAERAPGLHVILVESDQRKAEFLRSAARLCGVAVTVHAERIDTVPPLHADVVSARALAPLTDLLGFAARHLRPGGVALFPKGAGHEAEVAAALERWRFSVQKHSSRTDRDSVVLRIGDIARA